ncbi:PREDICTED: FRAS1-related extracellular matrix protein 1-like, partial [Priapulus caudatus]|uniref:FRAS1-related extracellular matrix protein 1-like n=1 Tax=Priapulus caudatus TaxID=37621 RepID=A0ABM1F6G2_PRICU
AAITIIPDLVNASRAKSLLPRHGVAVGNLLFEMLETPSHGDVTLRGHPLAEGDTFAEADLESHQVAYQHDHSDTTRDEFRFALKFDDIPVLDAYALDARVGVVVVPMNDQPFVLVTQTPSLKVVQGTRTAITAKQLETRDPDTPPEEIR